MPVNYPVVTDIGRQVYHINEYGLASMYLIVGSRRALLIDTGVGYCDLKALVRRLTLLPYDVVVTHGHVGHAGGIGQFKKVYIHPEDQKQALKLDKNKRVEFASRRRETDDVGVWGYDTEKSVYEWSNQPEIGELYDGLEFDLGDRIVTTVYSPGHTLGSCSFVDSGSKIIFTGDMVDRVQIITECALSTAARGLFNIYRHRNEFEQIFGGHTNYKTVERTLSVKYQVLLDNIATIRCVLEDNTFAEENRPKYAKDSNEMYEFGMAKLTFDPNKLWEPEENRFATVMGTKG